MTKIPCYYCNAPLPPTRKQCPKCKRIQLLNNGSYRIQRILGEGGYGLVFEALDTRLDRRCAIKQIRATTDKAQHSIESEARLLAKNAKRFPSFIPDIYDIWKEDYDTYLVMTYIEGNTLNQITEQQGKWYATEVETFLCTLLDYLDQMDNAGLLHRDIKPDNIIQTPDGRYVLIDFGIAKQGDATRVEVRGAYSRFFAPPEQQRSLPTDLRSDLYSLGATAYYLLTGGGFLEDGEDRRQHNVPLHPPSHWGAVVPASLEHTIMRMLELEPLDRPQDVRAALRMLDAPPDVREEITAGNIDRMRKLRTLVGRNGRQDTLTFGGWSSDGSAWLSILNGSIHGITISSDDLPLKLRDRDGAVLGRLKQQTCYWNTDHSALVAFVSADGKDAGVQVWYVGGKVIKLPKRDDIWYAFWNVDGSHLVIGHYIDNGWSPKTATIWRKDKKLDPAGFSDSHLANEGFPEPKMLYRTRDFLTTHEYLCSADGMILVNYRTDDDDNLLEAKLWDAQTEKFYPIQLQLRLPATFSYDSMAWHPTKSELAIGWDDGIVQLVDGRGTVTNQCTNPTPAIAHLDWSPNGKLLHVASTEDMIALWWMADADPRCVWHGTRSALAHGPNWRMFSVLQADGTVQIFSADGTPRATISDLPSHVRQVEWNPFERMVALVLEDGTVRVYHSDGKLHCGLAISDRTITAVEWSPDARFILTRLDTDEVWLWTTQGGRYVRSFTGTLYWSPDGRTIALLPLDAHTIELWGIK